MVNDFIKLENKIVFCIKNTKKDVVMTEKIIEIIVFVNFMKKNESDKVRDHWHLTGKYRGPGHSKCTINVTQKQSNFIPFIFHELSNYDWHLFFKTLFDKKDDKVKFDIKPKTNEEYISVKYGCIRYIASYRLLSSSLDSLVRTLVDNSHKTLKNWKKKVLIMKNY